VVTQLPYALIVAFISLSGYIVLGFTQSLLYGLLTCSGIFIVSVLILKVKANKYF
jgi:tetracycline resistance efflux pump